MQEVIAKALFSTAVFRFNNKPHIDIRNPKGYSFPMIKSFKHKGLENFFYSSTKKGIKPEHAGKLERILDRLHASSDLKDMNYPGSNLHMLSGDRNG